MRDASASLRAWTLQPSRAREGWEARRRWDLRLRVGGARTRVHSTGRHSPRPEPT
uniref:Uncharacterized protein n=1 Tax=Arundo donax TaxID=35708 RepID=A0A0A9F748_ARUDO